MRSQKYRIVTFRDVAKLYGERPKDERVWYLSPYEFITLGEVKMLSYPQSLADQHHRRHHAELTETGKHKLKAGTTYDQDSELHPGIDYCVRQILARRGCHFLIFHLPSISVIRGSLKNGNARLLLYS